MANYFYISGYWKDDDEEFEDYLVTDASDEDEVDVPDGKIFYYGLSEENIIDCIAFEKGTDLEFVIESYEEAILV